MVAQPVADYATLALDLKKRRHFFELQRTRDQPQRRELLKHWNRLHRTFTELTRHYPDKATHTWETVERILNADPFAPGDTTVIGEDHDPLPPPPAAPFVWDVSDEERDEWLYDEGLSVDSRGNPLPRIKEIRTDRPEYHQDPAYRLFALREIVDKNAVTNEYAGTNVIALIEELDSYGYADVGPIPTMATLKDMVRDLLWMWQPFLDKVKRLDAQLDGAYDPDADLDATLLRIAMQDRHDQIADEIGYALERELFEVARRPWDEEAVHTLAKSYRFGLVRDAYERYYDEREDMWAKPEPFIDVAERLDRYETLARDPLALREQLDQGLRDITPDRTLGLRQPDWRRHTPSFLGNITPSEPVERFYSMSDVLFYSLVRARTRRSNGPAMTPLVLTPLTSSHLLSYELPSALDTVRIFTLALWVDEANGSNVTGAVLDHLIRYGDLPYEVVHGALAKAHEAMAQEATRLDGFRERVYRKELNMTR